MVAVATIYDTTPPPDFSLYFDISDFHVYVYVFLKIPIPSPDSDS